MFIDRIVPAPGRRRARLIGGWAMAARALTALLGGYAAASVLATLLARLLPGDRAEATIWGMIASFPLYAVIGLWCFHECRLLRVATIVWGIALLGAATLHLLGVRP